MIHTKTIHHILTNTSLPKSEALLLLAHILEQRKEYILAHKDTQLPLRAYIRYRYLARKRKKHTPLAYLIGHKEFFGLDFFVTKHTLVPRPETELLVTLGMQAYENTPAPQTIFIDIGTGSGCIPISLATYLKRRETAPVVFFATDISMNALKVAQKNANRYAHRITFFHGSLIEPVESTLTGLNTETHIIITANLPYVTEEQYTLEPSIQKEPKSALVAGDQGLALYKKLLEHIPPLIPNFQFPISLFMEIDPTQTKPLSEYITKILPKALIEVHKDLAGHDRVVHVTVGR